MLDFLNLHDEAEIMILLLLAAGFFFTLSWCRLSVFTEKETDILSMILLGLSLVLGGFACVPGFIMLITFKLKMLTKAILFAGAVVGVFFGIVYSICFKIRAAKYKKNPVMKEILAFCRKQDVHAILCVHDGVVFMKRIQHEPYCKSNEETHNEFTFSGFQAATSADRRPTGFQEAMRPEGCIGKIVFADRGYPSLPDVRFFGKVLKKSLKGYGLATHKVSIQYDEKSPGKIVHHITHVYSDCFVFKKAARKALRRKNAKVLIRGERQETKTGKTWE